MFEQIESNRPKDGEILSSVARTGGAVRLRERRCQAPNADCVQIVYQPLLTAHKVIVVVVDSQVVHHLCMINDLDRLYLAIAAVGFKGRCITCTE